MAWVLCCLAAVWSLSHGPLFCDPTGCSSPVHRISQAGILEWVAISLSKGSSWPGDQTRVSCTAGGFFTLCVSHFSRVWLCEPRHCGPVGPLSVGFCRQACWEGLPGSSRGSSRACSDGSFPASPECQLCPMSHWPHLRAPPRTGTRWQPRTWWCEPAVSWRIEGGGYPATGWARETTFLYTSSP